MHFTAHTIQGSGRGKGLNVPTINLDLSNVPRDLAEGIYACVVRIEARPHPAALHFGPRPVFGDTPSCEVHVIDTVIPNVPELIDIEVVERLRDIANFASKEDLMAQMQRDIVACRAILGRHDSSQPETSHS